MSTNSTILAADFVVARRSFPVSLELVLGAGERFSLFGTSGAGKTTCLEAIAGWAALEQGQVSLDGRVVNAARRRPSRAGRVRPVDPRHRQVALVRQPTTLFPHMSVRANVSYALRHTRRSDRFVDAWLDKVGLGGLGDAMPEALSGGQRQRACLARALAHPYKALLLDEPFSAVDASGRSRLRSLAADEAAAASAPAVLVTHDLSEAQAFGHKLGVMARGELLQVGLPDEVVRSPATVRVADLCGYRSYLRHESGKLWALHPERFESGAHPDRGVVIRGEVRAIQPHGPRYACEISTSGDLGLATTVRVHTDAPPRAGDVWSVTAIDPPLVKSDRPAAVMG